MSAPPNFDRVARAYQWLEYAILGRSLERAREQYLHCLANHRRALVLGDGDGRFTAKLLAAYPELRVQAIDTSPAMLALLRQRAGATERLQTFCTDAQVFVPYESPDLLVTHFFLDCFRQEEVDALTQRLTECLPTEGLWVVSEFRIPAGWRRVPAWLFVRGLYLAFRVLTGLRTSDLPDHQTALRSAGLKLQARELSFGGLLTSELWRKP